MSILDKARSLLAPKTQQQVELRRVASEKAKQQETVTAMVMASTLPDDMKLAILGNPQTNGVTPDNWPTRLAELKDIRDAAFAARMPAFAATAAATGISVDVARKALVNARAEASDAVGEIVTAIPERARRESAEQVFARRKTP
jgi:hypothetical protein